jgi:hypothetical protein
MKSLVEVMVISHLFYTICIFIAALCHLSQLM